MRLLLFLSALALLGACTPNAPYRTESSVCTSSDADEIIAECAKNSFQQFVPDDVDAGAYDLGFVEFDDQGQMHDEGQLGLLRKQLDDIAGSNEMILVVFVHGWKHNAHAGPEAGEEDNNITHFRQVLRSISQTETTQNPDSPRKVVGVYLGWRGLSVTLPGIKQLSFWERKNTAHKVGKGAITETLLMLETVVAADNAKLGSHSGKPKSRYIVIGHSFGGAAVYSASAQLLLDRYMRADCYNDRDCAVSGVGDLVVLINPAFEAMRFSTLRNATDRAEGYARGQLPILVILTSEDDNATKQAFPAGRFFSTLFEDERNERDQHAKNITAVGHYEPYHTHRLEAIEGASSEAKPDITLADQFQTFLRFSHDWDDPDKTDMEFEDIGIQLKKIGQRDRYNPYLSIYVDGELIPGHNEIYDPRITEFIRQIIMLSVQEDDAKIRAMQRSTMEGYIRAAKEQ